MPLSKKRQAEKRKHWRQIIANWEQSELSQTEFCKQQGVKYSNFAKWRQRLRELDSQPRLLPATVATETLAVNGSEDLPTTFKITLDNRHVIELPLTLSGNQLQAIFKSLGFNYA